jgi:hypothetical protein
MSVKFHPCTLLTVLAAFVYTPPHPISNEKRMVSDSG